MIDAYVDDVQADQNGPVARFAATRRQESSPKRGKNMTAIWMEFLDTETNNRKLASLKEERRARLRAARKRHKTSAALEPSGSAGSPAIISVRQGLSRWGKGSARIGRIERFASALSNSRAAAIAS